MGAGYFVQNIRSRFPPGEALKPIAINLLFILAGTMLVALSLNTVYIPNGLLAGGITGLALVLFYLFKIPVYLSIILLNIPVFWWGAREINRGFLFYSLAGTIALSAELPTIQGTLPIPQIDLILAAIYGGAISGAGFGLVFRGQGSTGGTDIVAVILRKKKNLGIGEVTFYSNLLVITISLMFFPLNTGLYTIISMFVTGKIIDIVITGLNTSKSVIIVSNQSAQIGGRIINELHRGVTYFTGAGAFTQTEKNVVNCVVHRFELARLKRIVTEVDPEAFMYISDASEVLGKGFSRGK